MIVNQMFDSPVRCLPLNMLQVDRRIIGHGPRCRNNGIGYGMVGQVLGEGYGFRLGSKRTRSVSLAAAIPVIHSPGFVRLLLNTWLMFSFTLHARYLSPFFLANS